MDDAPFCSDSDCRVVNKLSAMLKGISRSESGCRLTLSARCLQVLYEGFRHVQSASCIKLSHTHREETFFSSLTHLQDVVQNMKDLMIIDSGETLQGHVDCTDFSSVTSLEVKCLPLYQLYGLSKVAPNLSKMTCTGCVNRIQELLEQCGADTFRASDVLWSKLTEIHLAYNNLQSLDNSLKLVTKLTHFDGSHNKISSTDEFLMVLDNLKNLNLSYNSLRTFPEISRLANRHLTHLNLRNNLITSLKGLSHLFCLQYLDISNNLLTDSTTLNNIKSLLMLYCLVLAGNPVSFHPLYRCIIIGCLHPAVVAQIKFDGQKLSRREKKQFDQLQAENLGSTSRLASDFLESIDDSVNSNYESMSDSQRTSHRRRRPRLVEIENQEDSCQETNEFQKIENSLEFYDSTRVHSVPSSSCTEHDGERIDSGLRSSKNQASIISRGNSSCSSSSRRMKSKLHHLTSPRLNGSSKDLETDSVQNNISITGNRLNFVGGVNDNFSNHLGAEEEEEAKIISRNSGVNAFRQSSDKNLLVTDRLNEDSRQLIADDSAIAAETSVNPDSRSINDSSRLKPQDELSAGDLISSNSSVIVLPPERVTLHSAASDSCQASADALAENSGDTPHTAGNVSTSTGSIQVGKLPASAELVPDISASRKMPSRCEADSNQRHPVSRSFSYNVSKENARTLDETFEDDVLRSLDDCEGNKRLTSEYNSVDAESLGAEDITLDSIMENGFEDDFLVYLVAGASDRNVSDKCIVSVIDNWLYIRTAKDVVERIDLRGLLAVQKVADHFSNYVTRQDTTATFDASFPGPVVRLLFDGVGQDRRERLFSMKDQNHGKQFARLLKSFIKTKSNAKMQCLRCDFHFDESEGKIVNSDVTATDIRRSTKLKGAGDRFVMHCPKCDSHFVIEVSERMGSLSAKNSQTITWLDQAGDKNLRHKKRRKNKRNAIHDASSVSQPPNSLSSSFSFSFMQRRNTAEDSLLSNDALKLVVDGKMIEKIPDDASAVDAVQFYIDPSEE